jgi:thiamine-phosphate pyrophosphorylase
MIDKIFYKHYVFLEQINKLIEENLLKFNDINIIINVNNNNKNSLDNEIKIINFAKKKKIRFLFKNNIRKCIKYNSDGIFIDSINKETIKSTLFKKNFLIIGTAHNQLEYYFKKRQNCKIIALSPIFYNPKFSKNKTLGPTRFNLITQIWDADLCALGGINKTNIKKLNITRASAIAFQRYITK